MIIVFSILIVLIPCFSFTQTTDLERKSDKNILNQTNFPNENELAAKYLEKGNSLYLAGSYREAINAYTIATVMNPELTEAYYQRGFAHHNLGNYESAIRDYSRALTLSPELAEVRTKLKDAKAMFDKNNLDTKNVRVIQPLTPEKRQEIEEKKNKRKKEISERKKPKPVPGIVACLASAEKEYRDSWEQECVYSSLDRNCRLPSYKSKFLDDRYKQRRDDCSRLYPTGVSSTQIK